jgi:glycosyltransferase involved in cell wall biosynthesis
MTRAPTVLHLAAVEYTAQVLLLPQMTALKDAGFDVRVGCAPGPQGFSSMLSPFRPVNIAFPRSVRPTAMARAASRLVAAVNAIEPDLVHLHSPAVAMPARLIPRRLLPRRTRVAYTVHGFAHQWDAPTPRDRLLERVERVLAPRTDMLLFQSREDLEQAGRRHYGGRHTYLGNGVQDDWFEDVRRVRHRPLQLLFIGRFVREKGLLDLLDALEHVHGAELSIAGGRLSTDRDDIEPEVRRRISSPTLAGRVRLLGVLPRLQLLQQVRDSDVIVLPSYREGVPRSLIEGLANGLPAVATHIRGCRELVEHGRNGLLVPPGDVAGIAAAIHTMVHMPDDQYARMCREAHETAAARHRESAVIDRLLAAYADLGISP